MVTIYLSDIDGYIHFKADGDKFTFLVDELFKSYYLPYNSSTKTFYCEPNLKCKTIYEDVADYDTINISDEDKDLIEHITVYEHSNDLKKVRRVLDKDIITNHPPFKGKKGYEDFQLEASRKLVQRNRALLDISCRHGKTAITCYSWGTLIKNNIVDKTLIVCRNEGVENFRQEILKLLDFVSEDDIGVVYTNDRDIRKYFDKKIIITNYITFRLTCEYINPKASKLTRKPIIDFSKWGNNRMIILDEVQSINHYDSLQTHMVQLHRDYFEYRYGLSGTLGFNFLNWYSLAKFMLPNELTMSFSDWKKYISYGKYNEKIDENKAKEFKEQILDKLLITYHDCIEQKKDRKRITYCAMNEKMRNIYIEICEKYMLDLFKIGNGKIHSNDLLLKFGELSKITSNPSLIKGYEKFPIEDNSKFEVLKSLLEKYIDEENNRVVIWSTHPSILNMLADKLKKYKPLVIHGDANTSVKKKDRNDELEMFKKDNSRKILLTNKVLSTSISIVECNRQIYWDLPLNSDDLSQSMERVRGPMQTTETETNILLFSNSIDLYIYNEILSKKSKVRDVILSKEYIDVKDFKNMLNPPRKYNIEGEYLYNGGING